MSELGMRSLKFRKVPCARENTYLVLRTCLRHAVVVVQEGRLKPTVGSSQWLCILMLVFANAFLFFL